MDTLAKDTWTKDTWAKDTWAKDTWAKDNLTKMDIYRISCKGSFNNYVNRILTFFDHPPTPSKQM